MFTRKLSKQTKLMMLLVFVPLYFFCGSIIVQAIIKFSIIQFSLKLNEVDANAYLNLNIDFMFVFVAIWIFKDELIEQMKDFLKDKKNHILYGCVIGFALMFLANIVGGIISIALGAQTDSQNQIFLENIFQSHPVIILTTAVIFAPIVEEILFRGTLFSWLYEIHPMVAHLVSSFVFGFLHIMDAVLSGNMSEWIMIFGYMFMGLVLSFLYEKRNNIYVPIMTHAIHNLYSVIFMLF